MSNMTPANASADSPPLQMVPGQSEGENRNAELAVTRQPNARPAFVVLRKVAGCAKQLAAVAVAIDNVLKKTDLGIKSDFDCATEVKTVTRESAPPAMRVKLTSPLELVKGEAVQVVVWLEDRPLEVGSGGCTRTTLMARAT